MRSRPLVALVFIGTLLASIGIPAGAHAQQAALSEPAAVLPEAPQPQVASLVYGSITPQSEPAQTGASSSTSSSQDPPSETVTAKSQRDKARQEIKEQEHQRVLGILPAFNTSYRDDAVSLTAKEKINVAFRSAVDPVAFGSALVVAGLKEGLDDDTEFGWGPAGYGKRAGASYLDAFDGTMIGNGFLPAILHQDPRYFRLGHGTTKHRLIYAVASGFICKHDTTRKWEPNYSNMLGNMAAGAISNLYYSTDDSGFGQTVSDGLVVTAEGTLGSVFQEFWPDISRKFLHKDPTRGLDAEARAADKAAKASQRLQ